eukprot:7006093-Ditylum_brightwellii.AAC.1
MDRKDGDDVMDDDDVVVVRNGGVVVAVRRDVTVPKDAGVKASTKDDAEITDRVIRAIVANLLLLLLLLSDAIVADGD